MILAKNLVTKDIPALKPDDSGSQALSIMEVFKLPQLPVVDRREYLGLVSDSDIYGWLEPDGLMRDQPVSANRPFAFEDWPLFKILATFSNLKLSILPVLNQQEEYSGLVTLSGLVSAVSALTFSPEPGAVVVIRLNASDYFLSQISQIVESNGAKILSLFFTPLPDSVQYDLTLKLNVMDVSSMLQTFERYNYQVVSSFGEENRMNDFLQDRFEGFLRYLNV